MTRPSWSGVITFGLVSVPVQLFPAVREHSVRFHRRHRRTGDRVRDRRVNERTGERVDYEDVVRAYDLGNGEHVAVEPEELEEIAPGRSRVIEVGGFVGLEEIDPAYFADAYYLAPTGDEHARVHRLLRTVLLESGKAGIATFVMHGREHLAALCAREDVLELLTLHWTDEIRDPRRELPRLPGPGQPGGAELEGVRRLVEAMSADWRPEEYQETFERRVRRLVDAKRSGEPVPVEEGPPVATGAAGLEEALRRSVERAGTGAGTGASGAGAGAGAWAGAGAGAGPGPSRDTGRGLSEMSKRDLYERATERDVPGRSRMNRQQLIRALSGDRPRRAAS